MSIESPQDVNILLAEFLAFVIPRSATPFVVELCQFVAKGSKENKRTHTKKSSSVL